MGESEKSIESQMALQHVDCGAYCRFIEENHETKSALYQCQRCSKYFIITAYQEEQATENNPPQEESSFVKDYREDVVPATEPETVQEKPRKRNNVNKP